MSFKKWIGSVGVATLVAGGLTFGVAAPASASSCDAAVWSYNTSINISTILPTPCYRVQARMYRLLSGSIQTLLGPESASSSHISNSNGSNAGNHVRWKPTSSESWSGWVSAPLK